MHTTPRPAAYLRRSHVDSASPGDISREAQRSAVRKLAAADGHNGDLVEYDDFGVSADVAKTARRTAYTRLLADMEAGRVSAVYAFDVDRLYRDPSDLIRLQQAAQGHQVRVVATSGVVPIGEGADPDAEWFAYLQATLGRREVQKAKKRAAAARDARRARGDVFGHAPYGYQRARDADGRVLHLPDTRRPLQPVLDAFNEAGSFAGTARLLNTRDVPSPFGKKWAANAVGRVIRREWPKLVPAGRVVERVAARGSQRFSRLLRCSCGQMLTPRVTHTVTKYGRYGPYVGYQCYRGRHDPAHPRPYMVAEERIVEWAQAEAARLRTPKRVRLAERNDRRRSELEGQRERLGWAVTDGLLNREQAQERGAAIKGEMARLAAQEAIVDVPAIDWTWPATELNGALRALWAHIELDNAMQPVRASWLVPEWRAENGPRQGRNRR